MDEKTTLTQCMGAGCHAGCIHTVRVRDGKIVKLSRTDYPNGEKGVICRKGVAGARLPYLPDRLKHPLKRAGKRGEGKWERVTWEQALEEIADKLKSIREEYKPESVVLVPFCNTHHSHAGTQYMLGTRLKHLLEASDIMAGSGIDSNPIFAAHFNFGSYASAFGDPRWLVEGNTKYMIVWAGNPAEMAPRLWKYIGEARKRGAKLVDIGVLRDPTADAADLFIQVQPGSDAALALAMIHVIIKEGLYDRDYITQYTNLPFLVRQDSGKLLRESDISADGSKENYVIWDSENNRAYGVAPHAQEPAGGRPAITGTVEAGGIECKPAFQMLTDLAEKNSPESVEEITGVSPGTVETLAREYATTKPAVILQSFGLRYKNGGNAYMAMNTLAALTGNIGTLGGGSFGGMVTSGAANTPLLRFNDDPILFPTEARARTIPMAEAFQCMITGSPYPIKALVIYGANWVNTLPNRQRWIKEVFPNLELIVVNDIFMTATAEYADYVLPDTTAFEEEDIHIGHGGGNIVYLDKAIEPIGDCRPAIYFWTELAKGLGFGEYFDKTLEEWTTLRFNSEDPSVAGIDPPLTLKRLKKEKIIQPNTPPGMLNFPLDKKFSTPSGRMEFYREELLPAGDALPVFREQQESPRSDLAKKYPLAFLTANNKFFVHTLLANDPENLKSYKTEPHISVNPEDAEKRGIKEGDTVSVYNDRGSCTVKATVSETVPPGVVHIPHGWWPKQFIEGHLQNLVSSLASMENRDETREIMWDLVTGAVGLEGVMEDMTAVFAYSPDILFDCLCEVKKVGEE